MSINIGADSWLFEKDPFGTDPAEREKAYNARERHKYERTVSGYSFYDWINADKFICGIIASIVKKFMDEGSGYPGHLTEQEWRDILTTIYEPLRAYAADRAYWDDAEETKIREDAQEALHAFADYMPHFWD